MLQLKSSILSSFIKLPKNSNDIHITTSNPKRKISPNLSVFFNNKERIELLYKCGTMIEKISKKLNDFENKADCNKNTYIDNLWNDIKSLDTRIVSLLESGGLPNFCTLNGYIYTDRKYDCNELCKNIPDEYIKEFKNIFSNICNYINMFQKYCPAYEYFAYYNYFKIEKNELFCKVKPYIVLPNSLCKQMNQPKKYNYLHTSHNYKILLVENPIININNDYFDYNLSFFYKYCNIKFTEKNQNLQIQFDKFITINTKLSAARLIKYNIKEITTKTPFFYQYNNTIYLLNTSNDVPALNTLPFNIVSSSFILKPNIINYNSPNTFCELKYYIPHKFLNCLITLASYNKSIINLISALTANCLMAYPLSKKLFVIKANDNKSSEKIKKFISSLISYNNLRYSVSKNDCVEILEYHSINDFCKYARFKEIHSLRYANIKAIFLPFRG